MLMSYFYKLQVKRSGGVAVTKNYQVNKTTTFTQTNNDN